MGLNVWTGVAVDVESARATAIAISGITNADPAVVTHAGADPANGAIVALTVQGMNKLNRRVAEVINSGAGTFQLKGINTTDYGAFSSGSFEVLTLGVSANTFTDLSSSGGEFAFTDTTTIHEDVDTQIPTNSSAAVYSFGSQWDPADLALIALAALSDKQAVAAMRFTFKTGAKVMFQGYIGATLLPTGSKGEVVKTPISVTMYGRATSYAS